MATAFLTRMESTHYKRSESDRIRRLSGITWRSISIATLLIPLNAYWVVQMELIRYSAHPTTISLLFNAIFILLVLTAANTLYARLSPGRQLTQPELLAIYSMVCVASAITGHDFLEILVSGLAGPFMYATPENRWAELFNWRLPNWLYVQDKAAMAEYFTGNSTLYTKQHLLGWAVPVLMWTLFVGLLLLVMLSVNAILRQQWDKREALTYPLTLLPLEITHPGGQLFRQRLLWIGFGIAAFIDAVNSVAFYHPGVPRIRVDYINLLSLMNAGRPWSSASCFPISFYPFMIGIGMLMPLDFLFSCWFFYLFWRAEVIIATLLGYQPGCFFNQSDIPYINHQAFGAYIVFCVFAIWQSRRHLAAVGRRALGLAGGAEDVEEPASYRVAVGGALLGLVGIMVFTHAMGMSLPVVIAFFAIYFALSMAIIRMRAEFGSPVHDMHYSGPNYMLTSILGSANFRPQDLTVIAQSFWFNRAYRSHPMPHQLEGFRMMRSAGSLDRRYFPALLAIGVFATLAGFWAMLHLNYSYGAMSKSAAQDNGGWLPWQLQGWLTSPQGPNYSAAVAVAVGFGLAFFLAKMRLMLPGWPLHPLGFAISTNWEMGLVWVPLLVAWIIKFFLLRYSGLRGFRRALPFFYGLILGQFVVGSLLNLITMALGIQRSYMFWQ